MQCNAGCSVCCTELVILMPHSSLFLLSPSPPLCAFAPLLPHLLYVCAQFPPSACAQRRTLCHRICTIRATLVLALCLHLSPTTMNSTWSWMATIKELNALGYLMRSSLILMKWVNVINATNIIFNLYRVSVLHEYFVCLCACCVFMLYVVRALCMFCVALCVFWIVLYYPCFVFLFCAVLYVMCCVWHYVCYSVWCVCLIVWCVIYVSLCGGWCCIFCLVCDTTHGAFWWKEILMSQRDFWPLHSKLK